MQKVILAVRLKVYKRPIGLENHSFAVLSQFIAAKIFTHRPMLVSLITLISYYRCFSFFGLSSKSGIAFLFVLITTANVGVDGASALGFLVDPSESLYSRGVY